MLDALIIGAGPAGLTCLLYLTLYKLNALCVGDVIGGKVLFAPHIVDFPGIEGISGKEYIAHLLTQLENLKVQPTVDEIRNAHPGQENTFAIELASGKQYSAKSLVIASGNGNKQKENRGLKLANQLGLATERGFIKTQTQSTTHVKGVFAAGDCMLYPISLEQLTTSVSTGITAAAAAYEYISKSKPPIIWGKSRIQRM